MSEPQQKDEYGCIRDPLRCGNCGSDLVRLYNVCEPGDERRKDMIELEARCAKEGCGTVSIIRVFNSIRVQFGEGSPGVLCGGWSGR
jgi:hypothetical protein